LALGIVDGVTAGGAKGTPVMKDCQHEASRCKISRCKTLWRKAVRVRSR
jgi:hypothetical protein